MNYTVHLDSNELRKLSWDIMHYADEFENKVKIFLNRLADLGIEVASVNGGDFSRYIIYRKKMDDETTIVISASSKLLRTEWYAGSNSKESRSEVISPLLMAEFGSGHHAISNKNAPGLGGQGTLNKYGHAFDSDGWYWYADTPPKGSDAKAVKTAKSGRVKYHSSGVVPTQPLHKAVMACIEQVRGIAQEVFG